MVTFQLATVADAPLLEQLAREIWFLHYPGIISDAQISYMLDVQYSVAAIVEGMSAGKIWQITRVEGVAVGFISYALVSPGVCKLEKIYFHPDFQNRGIGRQALALALQYARRRGATQLMLYVNRKNTRSISAYERFGFFIVREEDSYLGPYLLDDYVMAMEVPQ